MPYSMIDTKSLTIAQAAKDLREKKYSSVELTEACLEVIAGKDSKINAFISVTKELALEQAEKADKLLANKAKGELIGIPYTLKDVFNTKGTKTTAGSKILKDYVSPYDSSIYWYLKDAGAVLLGKTNCDAFGHGSSTENSDFGVTKNPWDQSRVAGGSSGGSAAALAYGGGLFSIAEDTGGSIRKPAAFCSVRGLKPTYGVVSRYGCVSYASSLDTIGPMAKTAEDLSKVMDVISQTDPYDASQISGKSRSDQASPPPRCTIGIPKEYFRGDNDKEIDNKIEAAIKDLEKMGNKVKEVSLPNTKYAIETYYLLAASETSSNLSRYQELRYGGSRKEFNQENKRRIILGTFALSSGYHDEYYLKAAKVRTLIREDFNRLKSDIDVFIAPVSPVLPFKIGENSDDPLKMYLADIYTVTANVAGVPALSLPCGFSKDNLPIGMQLIGHHFSDPLLLSLGTQYQQEADWHKKRSEER